MTMTYKICMTKCKD